MSTPIDGFKRNLEQVVPDLIAECEKKVALAEAELDAQKDALKWILSVAHGGSVERNTRKAEAVTDAPYAAESQAMEEKP